MSRFIAALILLVPAVLLAQQPAAKLAPAEVGRYQLVRATEQEIILLDTATGKVYRVTPRDFNAVGDLLGRENVKPVKQGEAFKLVGSVVPGRTVSVFPETNGHVERFLANVGMKVKQGDILAVLESKQQKARGAEAEAGLVEARKRLEFATLVREKDLANLQAEAELLEKRNKALQQRQMELEKLFEQTGRPTVKDEVTRTRNELAIGQRRLQDARDKAELVKKALTPGQREVETAGVKTAEKTLAEARAALEVCTVRAPSNGTVLKRTEEDSADPKKPLFVLADLNHLEVEMSVSERDVGLVKRGQVCRVLCEAAQKKHPQGYQAEVTHVAPALDPVTRTLSVRARIRLPAEEDDRYLLPGMVVMVAFKKADK